MSHLHFFPWPPADLRERHSRHDVMLVTGGNTANMLAVWRVHGFDEILREAWESGVVLAGWSAGRDLLVRGAASPTRSARSCRRSTASASCPAVRARTTTARSAAGRVTRSSCATDFRRGSRIDDDVAVRYDGTELAEVVSARSGATAYRVGPTAKSALEARSLL